MKLANEECSMMIRTYRQYRRNVTSILERHRSEIRASCPDMIAHAPTKLGNVFMPFLPSTWYCDRKLFFNDLNHHYFKRWQARQP